MSFAEGLKDLPAGASRGLLLILTEQPGRDLRIAAEPERRAAGSHEGLLRELFSVLPVADDPVEVGEHGLLMGPEHIFKLHALDGRSH